MALVNVGGGATWECTGGLESVLESVGLGPGDKLIEDVVLKGKSRSHYMMQGAQTVVEVR